MYVYSAFGLRLHCDSQIPGLLPLRSKPPYDIKVNLGFVPPDLSQAVPPDDEAVYVSGETGENGLPSSRVWRVAEGEYYRILYDDGTDCAVDRSGAQIWVSWPDFFTVKDVVPYLQGQLLGLAQRLRGTLCLHASAVLVRDRAIAITGVSGAGKSTAAAAFLRIGYPVLADDVVAITESSGRYVIQPAHPRIWLCPDMVENFFGAADALPQLAPSWEKRYVDLTATGPGLPFEAKPVGAIYILSERTGNEGATVADAGPRELLLRLISNTYMNHLLDPDMRAQEFKMLSRLLRSVPVRVVHPPDNATLVHTLCDAICADIGQ